MRSDARVSGEYATKGLVGERINCTGRRLLRWRSGQNSTSPLVGGVPLGGSGTSGGATSAAYCFISAARLGGHSGRYLLTSVGVGVRVKVRVRIRVRVSWLADPSPSPNPNQVVTPAGTYLVTRYLLTQSALRNAPQERPISMSRSRSRSGLPGLGSGLGLG